MEWFTHHIHSPLQRLNPSGDGRFLIALVRELSRPAYSGVVDEPVLNLSEDGMVTVRLLFEAPSTNAAYRIAYRAVNPAVVAAGGVGPMLDVEVA